MAIVRNSIETVVKEAIKNAEKKVIIPQIFKIQPKPATQPKQSKPSK